MTDWQQPLVVALTQANGRVDRARDRVREPVRLHRRARRDGRRHRRASTRTASAVTPAGSAPRNFEQAAVITGPTPLHGADIVVPDLRGGFSHLIAALAAEGESTVSNVGIISRGYENFIAKLERWAPTSTLEG